MAAGKAHSRGMLSHDGEQLQGAVVQQALQQLPPQPASVVST